MTQNILIWLYQCLLPSNKTFPYILNSADSCDSNRESCNPNKSFFTNTSLFWAHAWKLFLPYCHTIFFVASVSLYTSLVLVVCETKINSFYRARVFQSVGICDGETKSYFSRSSLSHSHTVRLNWACEIGTINYHPIEKVQLHLTIVNWIARDHTHILWKKFVKKFRHCFKSVWLKLKCEKDLY